MDDADLTDPAVAADYDLAYADRDAQVERLKTVLAGHLPVVEGGWLLDVACGSGLASEAASMLGYTVIGVDESPAMLALAAQRLPGADLRLAACRRDRAATTNHYHAVDLSGQRPRATAPRAAGRARCAGCARGSGRTARCW